MFYMIKIKISFYIKLIKDSKYMFRFPTCTKCSSKNSSVKSTVRGRALALNIRIQLFN